MTNPRAALAQRYLFNHSLLAAATDGFPAAAWSKAPDGGGNTAHWILGHVVASRRFVARLAGVPLPQEPWEAQFGMGAKPQPGDVYPPVAELVAAFEGAGALLAEALPALDDSGLSKPLPRPFRDGSATVEGGLHFLYMHEVYHLGQLGYLRRMAGLPGFA